MGIDNQGVHAVDRPMIEIKEFRRFVVAGHEAGVRINRADFDLRGRWRRLINVALEQLLASGNPLRINRQILFGQIRSRRLFHLMHFKMPLVGVGLEMGAIGLEQTATNQLVFDRLFDDAV